MKCPFSETRTTVRKRVIHTKELCALTNEWCIVETDTCERRDFALKHGVTDAPPPRGHSTAQARAR